MPIRQFRLYANFKHDFCYWRQRFFGLTTEGKTTNAFGEAAYSEGARSRYLRRGGKVRR